MNESPNILLILTDQQRGDCIGVDSLAPDVLQTPNLDWLANSGTRFARGYSECPSCVPARRSLMSGTAPAANGMVGYQDGVDWEPPATLAGELTGAGYHTELIGKLHLHPARKPYGFQNVQLADATKGDNDYITWLKEECGRREQDPGFMHGVSANGWVGRPHVLPEEQMHTFWCVDRAIDYLRTRDQSAPAFLNLSFIDPHPPLTPPPFYYDRYIQRELPRPDVGDWAPLFDGPQRGLNPDASKLRLPDVDMQCCRAGYYGMINFIDDQLGRLFHACPELDEWLVIFTSDHGEMLGDHNLFRKTWPYEASARVPFLVRLPRSLQGPDQQVSHAPVGWQDIMPTILAAAGVPVPESCTGKSLFPIVRGEGDSVREILHGEHAGCYDYADGNHWITDGRMKYIWYSQTGAEQFFDLENDPREMENLAAQDGSSDLLSTWRANLAEFLLDRPESFTDGTKLIPGRPHNTLIPGYQPDRTYPFL
jgi:arylsulfatase A-like enzyme